MQQKVAGNGIDKIGSPYQVLDRDDNDGPLVEAPSIAKLPDGRYVLFFSSNCFYSINYDVTYAIADSKLLPCVSNIKFPPRFIHASPLGPAWARPTKLCILTHDINRGFRPVHQIRPALRLSRKARLLVARWRQHRRRRHPPCLPLVQPGRFRHPRHVHGNPEVGGQLRQRRSLRGERWEDEDEKHDHAVTNFLFRHHFILVFHTFMVI